MTTTIQIDRAVLEQALEALESCREGDYTTGHVIHPSFDEKAVAEAEAALRAALAEQAPAPVLTMDALRVEFERSHRGDLGLTRLSRGEYLSPAIETEWQQFVRKYTAPQPAKLTEQEKLAIMQRIVDSNTGFIRNPTTPQPAKQPLTDAEIDSLWAAIPNQALYKAVRAFARAIENVILGVKNNGSV